MSLQNNKSLGQHWLKNRQILDQITELARGDGDTACPSDTLRAALAKSSCSAEHVVSPPPLVVEIGPGLGTLTAALLRKFDKVIAVELDERLARNLPGSFPGKNLEVVNENFLDFDLDAVPAPYVVAGNIPYYITSPIIEKLLTVTNRPERIVLLMQKEVAERIVDRRETLLSIRCKNRAEVELGPEVPREEFEPAPEVDSRVVVFTPHEPVLSEKVMRFVQMGFSQPRKKVTRNLSVYMPRDEIQDIFIRNNINIDIRPAEIHLEDWQRFYDLLSPHFAKK